MSRTPRLRSRLLIGAFAGAVGAVAVTVALRDARLRQAARQGEAAPQEAPQARIACGAAFGALLAAADPRAGRVSGALAGAGIWVASLFGWLPGIARPTTLPFRRRNLVTIGTHLLWGVWTAGALQALRQVGRRVVSADDDGDEGAPG